MMGGHSLIPAHALAGRPLDGARRGEFHIKPLDAWATAESPLLEPPPPSACSTSGGCVDRSPVAIPRPPRREARVRGRGTGPMSSSGGSATMTGRTQPDAGRPHHAVAPPDGAKSPRERVPEEGPRSRAHSTTTKLTERCLTATAASRSSHVLRRRSLPRPGSGSAGRAERESPGLLPRPAEAAPARVRHCRALA